MTNAAALLVLLAPFAAAQMTDPAPASVKRLHDDFVEAVEEAPREPLLERLSRTQPVSQADIDALYDLWMRFTDKRVRGSALASLSLMNPSSPYLEPLFERYLNQPEPESKLFGIKGALRLKAGKALPAVRALAAKKFAQKEAADGPLEAERNAWWVQYEALGALAQWRPDEALPLLIKKSGEAPSVARLIGTHLWAQAQPQILKWAASSEPADRERAQRALEAPAPTAALRATRAAMLAALSDAKAPAELRHQFAVKVGVSSTPAEVDQLLKAHADAADPQTKLYFATALFSTRDKRAVPVLEEYAKGSPDANVRLGALIQLKDMLPPAEFRKLSDWFEKNDPDETNRAAAADGGAKLGTRP
jgi:hypothetical protein